MNSYKLKKKEIDNQLRCLIREASGNLSRSFKVINRDALIIELALMSSYELNLKTKGLLHETIRLLTEFDIVELDINFE